jgi:hypothetical protein
MKTKSKIMQFVFILYLMLNSANANAYIDPGTGSLLLQGLIAGIAAGAYTLKLYWYRFKSFFSRKDDKDEDLEEE